MFIKLTSINYYSITFNFIFFIIFFLWISFPIYPQLYQPIDTINLETKKISQQLTAQTKTLKKEFQSYPQKNNKVIKGFVQGRKKLIKELTQDNYFIKDKAFGNYLNGLLKTIAKNNGIKSDNLRAFIARDSEPNAFSLGDGNFVFNISLLSRLKNEEELKFIIAHELAHYQLNHLETEMANRMQLLNSKKFKNKQKQARKGRFNKVSRAINLFKDFQYGNHEAQRRKELQADSLGFKLIEKNMANPYHAISALQKIDSTSPSEIVKIDLETLKEHFSTTEMPFNEDWTSGYDFSKYNYQKGKVDIFGIHIDSLQTHPETQERISNLKAIADKPGTEPLAASAEFAELLKKFRLENVYAYYVSKDYGRGIYHIIQLQSLDNISDEEELFYQHMLSRFYHNLAIARRSFEFKKHVDNVNYLHFSEEYRLFLTILDNLRSNELEKLALKFNIN